MGLYVIGIILNKVIITLSIRCLIVYISHKRLAALSIAGYYIYPLPIKMQNQQGILSWKMQGFDGFLVLMKIHYLRI